MKLSNILYNFKVDVVYTYVNDEDCDFIENFNYWKKKLSGTLTPHSAISNRYKNYGELNYSIKSIEIFAPWVRNIYIVTSTKKPDWPILNSKKIHFINHEEIIPKKYLPLFNSFVIELYLANIPGLAEHFIYFNDDQFLGNFVEKKDFFTITGKCRLVFDKSIENMKIHKKNVFEIAYSNSLKIIKDKFNHKPDFLIHQAHPLLKSACCDCVKYFQKEVDILSKNKFRALNDLIFNNVIYPFYTLYKNKAVVSDLLLKSHVLAPINDDYNSNENNFRKILAKRPKLFCLNDETYLNKEDIKKQVVLFMKQYFCNEPTKKIRQKIEEKRSSQNLFWKTLVAIKDFLWIASEIFKTSKKIISDFLKTNYPKTKR